MSITQEQLAELREQHLNGEQALYFGQQIVEKMDNKMSADVAQINANKAAIATLVGEDTGKSARTIAVEELVKQLIPENANESRDTLEEIAAWIQEHPEDAAAMNLSIENIKTLIGTIPEDAIAADIVGYIVELVNAEETRAKAAEKANADAIDVLNGNAETEGSVDNKIAEATKDCVKTSDIKFATKESIDLIINAIFPSSEATE